MLKKIMCVLIVLILGITVFVTVKSYAVTDDDETQTEEVVETSSNAAGLIAAALAIGLSAIGSGIAVAVVASSAVGAVSENPSLLGKTVIFARLS